jgi:hypothetical protein
LLGLARKDGYKTCRARSCSPTAAFALLDEALGTTSVKWNSVRFKTCCRLLRFVMAGSLPLFPAAGNAGDLAAAQAHAADLRQRGRQLRAEIERVYAEKEAAHSLKPKFQRNPVTDTVVKYIPPGISFADAERILRAAGCTVDPHPNTGHATLEYDDAVVGRLEFQRSYLFDLVKFFSGFTVSLMPKAVGDYSTVEMVEADFWKGL